MASPPVSPRLAELLAALSLATDLGMGQPLEFAWQTCVLAMRLGEKLQFNDRELRAIYYQALLRYIGCNAETQLLAAIVGDELQLRADIIHADNTSLDILGTLTRFIRQANAGASPWPMAQAIVGGLAAASGMSKEFFSGHCEVAGRLAERLGLEANIVQALRQVYARWDGKGLPALKGEAIAPGMLVVSLAQDAIYVFRLGGLAAAVAMVKKRRGGMYAPKHVEVFCREAQELLTHLDDVPSWESVLALEPGPRPFLDEAGFDSACAAIADFADIKSPWLLGHSPGVARLSEGAARRCGLPEVDGVWLRRAALLHDLGRVGVSAGIWGKPGPLNDSDWEKVRLHPYHTERILARGPALAKLGTLAAFHHERLDGSGYHRGAVAAALSPSARILAAADVYHALTEPRPHRAAYTGEQAAEILKREAKVGRLDADAVSGVLATAGQRVSARRKELVAGLSEREVEVLRLLARGNTIKHMATQLSVAPKTVDNHIQHIYAKIGVTTRAGAALFAMEQNLL